MKLPYSLVKKINKSWFDFQFGVSVIIFLTFLNSKPVFGFIYTYTDLYRFLTPLCICTKSLILPPPEAFELHCSPLLNSTIDVFQTPPEYCVPFQATGPLGDLWLMVCVCVCVCVCFWGGSVPWNQGNKRCSGVRD